MATSARERQAARWLRTNDRRWLVIRAEVLAEEPVCEVVGCSLLSRHVDHRNGRADREEDYLRSNLQALCPGHHSEKTNQERQGLSWRPRGCSVDGTPHAVPVRSEPRRRARGGGDFGV